jgi:hypothetical protein
LVPRFERCFLGLFYQVWRWIPARLYISPSCVVFFAISRPCIYLHEPWFLRRIPGGLWMEFWICFFVSEVWYMFLPAII